MVFRSVHHACLICSYKETAWTVSVNVPLFERFLKRNLSDRIDSRIQFSSRINWIASLSQKRKKSIRMVTMWISKKFSYMYQESNINSRRQDQKHICNFGPVFALSSSNCHFWCFSLSFSRSVKTPSSVHSLHACTFPRGDLDGGIQLQTQFINCQLTLSHNESDIAMVSPIPLHCSLQESSENKLVAF